MSRDYITEYSYGGESFNLICPKTLCGSNEAVGTDSSMYSFMVGQGVPENKLLISPQVTHLLGDHYSSCSCVYREPVSLIDGVIY
jgi:hypothetical protein